MRKRLTAVLVFSTATAGFGQAHITKCDITAPAPTARTFAITEQQDHWREYRNLKDVPELSNDGGESAEFWREKSRGSSALIVDPGEDFWSYTRYCFDSSGRLARVGFELRTAWGWGFRLEGATVGKMLHPTSSQFFSTETGKPVPKPQNAEDIPDALNPTLYWSVSQLPFAKLLGTDTDQ